MIADITREGFLAATDSLRHGLSFGFGTVLQHPVLYATLIVSYLAPKRRKATETDHFQGIMLRSEQDHILDVLSPPCKVSGTSISSSF
jgi:hypothetical protein